MDKILLVKTGATGDVLRTSVLLHILQGEIYWITKQANIALFSQESSNIRFIAEEEIPGDLFSIEFDLLINFEEDLALARRLLAVKAKQTVGIHYGDNGLLYTADTAEWFDMSLISRFPWKADLLKQRNSKSFQQIMYGIFGKVFSGQEYSCYKGERIVHQAHVRVGIEKRVGHTWPNKNWYGYDELYSLLAEQGLDVRVFQPRKHLQQYFDDIRHCDLVVSGDTLAMHVAMAYKIPCVAIFNCTSPQEIYDYGVLSKMISPLLLHHFYQRERIPEVIESIPVQDVYKRILEILPALSISQKDQG